MWYIFVNNNLKVYDMMVKLLNFILYVKCCVYVIRSMKFSGYCCNCKKIVW